MTWITRNSALPLLTAAVCAIAALLPAPAQARHPICLTPVSGDGHEPPCNPYLGSDVWATPHRGSYQQDSSPFAGPAPGNTISVQRQEIPGEVPVIMPVSSPY